MTGQQLFTNTAFECSKVITNNYSTSFSMGIKMLAKKFHDPVYAIYGFVRYADEIVDTFHDHDKKALLLHFKQATFEAIDNRISLNPVLQAFQEVVYEYSIERSHIEAFLSSMEMDLYEIEYERSDYETYIFGSAEVVGLMCLKVFCYENEKKYRELEHSARKLGAAFQKVNFLRDMRSDYYERGRSYFPGFLISSFSQKDKSEIEAEIEADFKTAYTGILALPEGARFGVYVAYVYYLKLFTKIRNSGPKRLLNERIRVPNFEKFNLLVSSYFRDKLNMF